MKYKSDYKRLYYSTWRQISKISKNSCYINIIFRLFNSFCSFV